MALQLEQVCSKKERIRGQKLGGRGLHWTLKSKNKKMITQKKDFTQKIETTCSHG